MKTAITCLLFTLLFLQYSIELEAKTSPVGCKQLIQETISSQINVAELFQNAQSIFVAVVCRKEKLPIYEVLQAQMYSPEIIAKTTPVVSFSKLKQAINPNGVSNTTGILAVNREDLDQFTLKMRTRLSSGEAIDIKQQATLGVGQSITFEYRGVSVGLVRLPVKTKE